MKPITIPVPKSSRAFTLVELLALLAIVALLALLMVPALAGVQHKGGRVQCANNLRQIGNGAMAYANDFNDWLPPGQLGGNAFNVINGLYYSRWVWLSGGSPNTKIPTNYVNQSFNDGFQNAGYLYGGHYVSANTFYCPTQSGTPLGAEYYEPALTSDSSGNVRSSYAFNPRVNQAGTFGSGGNVRRFQKITQLPAHALLGVDYFEQTDIYAHARERGWNVLFTDTSVNFSTSQRAYAIIKTFMPQDGPNPYYNSFSDLFFNLLEADH